MNLFWSLWIIVLTVINLVLVLWVLLSNRKVAVRDDADQENRTTGHVYDGIEEYDNPLPRWWFQLFLLTLVFTVVYLVLFPGLGSYKGLLSWTSEQRLNDEMAAAEQRYGEMYQRMLATPIQELADDPQALKMGVRLFANHCSTCHGVDGGGNYGFPNLSDDDWLYGGEPANILATITNGRNGVMPGFGPILGDEGVVNVAQYVLSLSGLEHDADKASMGKARYDMICIACHGADGKGNILLGAPNLTDADTWLYSSSLADIERAIRDGRTNMMPAQKESLKPEKIHLLAAYVYSLSH